MKEYIERAMAFAVLVDFPGELSPENIGLAVARKAIDALPAADVAEVRHGRWNPEIHHTYIPVEYDQNGDPILHEYTSFRCSLCGREEPKEEPYCHCGARMGKEADHEVSE